MPILQVIIILPTDFKHFTKILLVSEILPMECLLSWVIPPEVTMRLWDTSLSTTILLESTMLLSGKIRSMEIRPLDIILPFDHMLSEHTTRGVLIPPFDHMLSIPIQVDIIISLLVHEHSTPILMETIM